MTTKWTAGLLVLALALSLTACGGQQDLSAADALASSSSAEGASPADTPPEEARHNLVDVVLGAAAEDLTGFLYCGNEPYLRIHNGGLIPEMGVSSALFSGRKGETGPYAAEQDAFVDELASALSKLAVDPASKTQMQEDYPIPDSDEYMGFWLSLGAWEPFLYFFDTGDLYVEVNSQSDRSAYHYRLADPAGYGDLARTMSEIEDAIDHMPLDYNFSLSIRLDLIRPESEAVKLFLQNKSGRTVRFSPAFTVEREVDGQWQRLEQLAPAAHAQAMQEIPPRSDIRWGIDLTGLQGGQDPGRYRVTNTFCYEGDEEVAFSAEYAISADAAQVSYPLPPGMTPENKVYCERYVEMWGFYNPFRDDFAEGAYPPSFHTYHLYYILSGMEGIRDNRGAYGDIPADFVEGIIAGHFAVSPEQIRSLSYTQEQNPGEYYDPAQKIYHFEGGYGGGYLTGIVTASSRDGDLLTLTCRWYNMDDSFSFEHVVTLRLGPGEEDFFYVKNRITETAGPIADYS